MTASGDAGCRDLPLLRPYMQTDGRTRATNELDLVSMIIATGHPLQGRLRPEHAEVLALCGFAVSIAEIAARSRMHLPVVKILVSDLIDCDAARVRGPVSIAEPDQELLEKVLRGLQRI